MHVPTITYHILTFGFSGGEQTIDREGGARVRQSEILVFRIPSYTA